MNDPVLTLVPPIAASDLETALRAVRLERLMIGPSRLTVSVEGGNIVVREAGE